MQDKGIPPGLGGAAPALPTRTLRRILAAGSIVVPGVTDALSARLVERAGFPAAYVTGAGLANSVFGLPDVGLVSRTELVEHVGRIREACRLPLIVDADTGFGGPLSVMRSVYQLERAGASAVQIEDQQDPKRCGHFEGQRLVTPPEMAEKIEAAARARSNPDLMVIARTDARNVMGLAEAISRAEAYLAAGADALFVEAPRSEAELAVVGSAFPGVPLVANLVEGGKTPLLPTARLEELGFRIILRASLLLRSMVSAAREALARLAADEADPAIEDRMISWGERQELVMLDEFDSLADDIRTERGGTV
ncbi:MAG: isocitrate lyase/phosphoenolpyruvate mutase family protein [bacterium]|nr:isocitrate lyase/phosphoenolpyruvate mutase family protein [bacterium]